MTKDQFNQTTTLQRVVKLHTMPREKWDKTVLIRVPLGLLFMGFAVFVANLGWPWYASGTLFVVGGATISTQFIKGAAMAMLEPIAAYRRALGKDVDDAAP